MDKNVEEKIFHMHAQICRTLASPTRLRIMNLLRKKEKSVGELLKLLMIHKANLSQHLAVLRQCNIVRTRRDGLTVYYSIANPKMIKACDILREVLFEQLKESRRLIGGAE